MCTSVHVFSLSNEEDFISETMLPGNDISFSKLPSGKIKMNGLLWAIILEKYLYCVCLLLRFQEIYLSLVGSLRPKVIQLDSGACELLTTSTSGEQLGTLTGFNRLSDSSWTSENNSDCGDAEVNSTEGLRMPLVTWEQRAVEQWVSFWISTITVVYIGLEKGKWLMFIHVAHD